MYLGCFLRGLQVVLCGSFKMSFQKWEKTDVFVIVFLIERSAWSGSKRSIDMDRLVEIPKGLGSNFLFQ